MLTVSGAGISGSLSATVITNALSSIFTLTSIAIAVNTTSAPAAGLPAGPVVSAEADGARLTLAGQTLTGDFGFEAGRDTSGNALVAIVASNVNLPLGSVGSLSDGSGVILVTSGEGVAASLTGTLSLNVPGITAAGTFAVQVNSTGNAITQGFSVGGQTVQLSLPASTGAYVQVAATGATRHRARPDAERRPHRHRHHRDDAERRHHAGQRRPLTRRGPRLGDRPDREPGHHADAT